MIHSRDQRCQCLLLNIGITDMAQLHTFVLTLIPVSLSDDGMDGRPDKGGSFDIGGICFSGKCPFGSEWPIGT